jgi:integrase
MAKTHLKLVSPATKKRTVVPKRPPNAELRTREHLTEVEVEKLMAATRDNRYGHRDSTMILVGYRHGLRASELTDLRWDQVDFTNGCMHVRRVKQGSPSTHPIRGDELRALRRLQREQQPKSPFVFTSERGSPFTTAGFARMLQRAGAEAKLAPTHATARLRLRLGEQGARYARCRPISATRISSTRSGTPNWRRPGSKTSGEIEFGIRRPHSVRGILSKRGQREE